MLVDSCDLDYIYEPLTAYRAFILEHLSKSVPQDADVLDFGCGSVGFYWALSYLHKANSISFIDRHPDIITQLSSRIESFTPENIEQDFPDVIAFLRDTLTPPLEIDPQEWLYDLHNKLSIIDTGDALADNPSQDYHSLVSIELFDTANTPEELEAMMRYCAGSLRGGGVLTGCCLNYKLWDTSLEQLSEHKMAGKLNPSAELLSEMAVKAGFQVVSMRTEETGMNKFPHAHFYEFKI